MPSIEEVIINTIAGGVGGAVALFVQQRFVWRPQKRTELRNKIFDDAMTALAMYETDALDAALQAQANSPQYSGQGLSPHVVLRQETRVALEKSRLQVQAFFPPVTSQAFDVALRTDVNLKNIPNTDFYVNAEKAMKLMAEDLGLL